MRHLLIVCAVLFSIKCFAQGQTHSQEHQNIIHSDTDSLKNDQKDQVIQNLNSQPFSPVEPFRKMQVPPSPQMAALGQFGEIPVNHSTGLAKVAVPIHTITVNGYEHEISLAYHGSGIKVNQAASNVGLGWALNATGALARNSNKIGGDQVQLPSNYIGFNPHTSTNLYEASRSNADYMWAHNGLNNCYDTEPDIINFNFGQYAGVMVPIQQGTYREIPYTGLQVQQGTNSYIIYDNYGTKFTFDVKETTYLPPGCPGSLYHSSGGCINAGIYNDSFYLSKIESKEGGTITFFYENENYTYAINRVEQKYSWIVGNGCQPDQNLIDNNCIQESWVTGKRLIKIETSENEQIIFKYKNETTSNGTREDLPGAKGLQYIEVYDKGQLSPLKTVEFTTSYFTSSGSTGPNHQAVWNKRLRLDQVKIDQDQIYSFTYNGNLSPRLSYDQDYYGYHIFNYVYTATPYDATHNPNGANRAPNANRVTAGLLNKLTYPTGGYSTFEYEQNIVFASNQNQAGPGVRIKRINAYTDTNVLSSYTDYKYILDGSTNSSGKINSLQSTYNFLDQQSQWQHDNDTGPYKLQCYFFSISSDDQQSSFLSKTYNPTYSRVEEIVHDGSQGKTVHHFSTVGDILTTTPVGIAAMDYDWTYGIPTKKEVFKGTGTSLEKIEETIIEYKTFLTNTTVYQSYAGPSSYYSFGMKLRRMRAEVEPGINWTFKPAVYKLHKYGYISALVSKKREITRSYKNGVNFETNVYYSIDSTNNRITKAVYKGSSSSGEGKSRYFYYTSQIGGQTSFLKYKDPILYLDKKIRGTSEYTVGGGYFPLSNVNGYSVHQKAYTLDLQHPTASYSLNLSNPPASVGFRLTNEVLTYNSKNYPTLISDENVKTKILYDYYDTKPVSFIRNFTGVDADIAYTSFETGNKGGWIYTIPSTLVRSSAYTGGVLHAVSGHPVSKSGLSSGKTYVLSFVVKRNGTETPNLIVKKGGVTITDSGISNADINSNWLIYQYSFTGSTSIQIEGSGILIDELRLQPAGSIMETFGHIPFVGLNYSASLDLIATNYSFNPQRRLSIIRNGYFERIKQYFYQYKAPLSF
ncbi:hypothetical protein [Algoriphagus sp. Y33]|uniref:hypothetical protein n=1 Tax=Algoriphagus sp. Y33 TaxID=2772483 RepID=UPI001785EFFB|nr:hypothetical protein [Algoriphagus sp. Y33]